jgi:hypothetical protein
MMLNPTEAENIIRTREGDLAAAHTFFIIERAKMDKYFSEFLEENDDEMSENFDSPQWKVYRDKLKEYDSIQRFITTSNFYLTQHV